MLIPLSGFCSIAQHLPSVFLFVCRSAVPAPGAEGPESPSHAGSAYRAAFQRPGIPGQRYPHPAEWLFHRECLARSPIGWRGNAGQSGTSVVDARPPHQRHRGCPHRGTRRGDWDGRKWTEQRHRGGNRFHQNPGPTASAEPPFPFRPRPATRRISRRSSR